MVRRASPALSSSLVISPMALIIPVNISLLPL
jgi:hypothetical protein